MLRRLDHCRPFATALVATFVLIPAVAVGQFGPPLPAGPPSPEPRVLAASGQPSTVVTIEIPLRNPVLGEGPGPMTVTPVGGQRSGATGNRILHPVSRNVQLVVGRPPSQQPVPRIGRGRLLNRVGNLIRELATGDEEGRQTVARRVSFWLRGDTPIDVQVGDERGPIERFRIVPERNATLHGELMSTWWQDTTSVAQVRLESADTPPWVQLYVIASLARQADQPLPDWYLDIVRGDGESAEQADPLLDALRWLGGSKEVFRQVFAATAASDRIAPSTSGFSGPIGDGGRVAGLPLPEAPGWRMTPPGDLDTGLPPDAMPDFESLADRVPPECFYLRYGSFENFLWFKDLTEEFGGDVAGMITLSGLDTAASARLEQQLGVKTTALSRMLGPSVITDQALIGTDLMLEDGASMGVVMEAANAFLLRNSLNNDRQTIVQNDPAVSIKTVRLEGVDVSLMRSADNRVRSFLVERDGAFLITNSETLARRFLQVARSGDSLADTEAFRRARRLVPLSRKDTLFLYVSPEMLQNLLSPASLIELRRRLQAEADILMLRLARLAAASPSSGGDAETPREEIDALVDAGWLPTGFGERADGSGVVSFGDQIIDTRRGRRGTFLPLADNPITTVTAEEADWYAEIAAAYNDRFSHLDPIVVGIRRDAIGGEEAGPAAAGDTAGRDAGVSRERLSIHAEIAPWQAAQYGWWAKQLGPPTRVAIEFAPDDIVAVQAHVASDALGPPTHLFAAIKDSNPPAPEEFDGLIGGYRSLKQLPGYLGAWPQPGALDRLPLGLGRGQPVGPGMNRLIGGMYRYTGGGFSVLSFQPSVLDASLPHLAAVEAETPAQVRLHVEDLNGSRLEGWVNQQSYQRDAQTCVAGASFLNSLHYQLDVPPEATIEVATKLLGGVPRCPLGGEYRWNASLGLWVSTAWQGGAEPPSAAPAAYRSPILTWFRGCDAIVRQTPNRLVTDAQLVVRRQTAAP